MKYQQKPQQCPRCGCIVSQKRTAGQPPLCAACRQLAEQAWARKHRYGLLDADFRQMYAEQDGKCAICQKPEDGTKNGQLSVDHCHKTNVIRGLLCHLCNIALGSLGDDPEKAEKVVAYLRRTQTPAAPNKVIPFRRVA